ncbi:hypothetical protein [endosymbiont GvMRE of Glomus versiforme]|uniref:hypothetical protein n=1 Tax=endosymbiont GvMRE of Glomus versiforme TaxID=2039283 RepID=UPI000ED09C3A|nr:hypothetical protein [endosymbiont GvMRE of Glomus versiforme]RHZ35934.1 hypothetical protein GvMRE_Ic4g112 [endosymbiont GvMRE of Glomus versiforme]
MPLPPLITTTPEGRRIYPLEITINSKKLSRLIIDPHFEKKHGNYVNDKLIWESVQQLNNGFFLPDPPKTLSTWQYFTIENMLHKGKYYCLVWCWKKENPNYIGIVNCY